MEKDELFNLLDSMQQAFSNLILVSNKIQIAGDRYCAPLTSRQFMALIAILHLDKNETSLVNIAGKLGTSKQNVSQIMASLQKKEFVTLNPSPKDKRSINVTITDIGMQVLTDCGLSGGLDFMADIFSRLTDEEISKLAVLLKKMYAFDGTEMDGLEQQVSIGQTQQSLPEIEQALKRLDEKRKRQRNKRY